jgi:hypothetical protein
MATTLLTALGALALTTTLGVQPQPPATQPVRPPDRPPAGEPAPPTTPESPFPARPRTGGGDGERTPAADDDPKPGTLTLQGCVQRPTEKTFRLRRVEGNDATVSEDVRLGGDVAQLRTHVGQIVEVRGTYEQETPTTTAATFRVATVRALTGTCAAK